MTTNTMYAILALQILTVAVLLTPGREPSPPVTTINDCRQTVIVIRGNETPPVPVNAARPDDP